MATMRMTGPACCCCNRLYVGIPSTNSNDQRRHDTTGSQPGSPPFWSLAASVYGRSLDFDPVHKLVFVARGNPATEGLSVFRYDEDFQNKTLLHTFGASEIPTAVTSDSDNQVLYIVTVDSLLTSTVTRGDLHSVNHDGTGYTSIGSITNTKQTVIGLHYCRANQKLYYTAGNADQKLYRINTDGTGDTLIASNATSSSDVLDVTVDNDSSRLFWVDRAGINGQTSRIYRSDLDGVGATLILQGAPLSSATINEQFLSPQWSHKHSKLYFWKQDLLQSSSADTGNGFSKCDDDGGNETLLIPRGQGTFDWWYLGTNSPFNIRLACGYENLGASSTA